MLHSFCLFVANCYHLNKENFFLLYIHFFFLHYNFMTSNWVLSLSAKCFACMKLN